MPPGRQASVGRNTSYICFWIRGNLSVKPIKPFYHWPPPPSQQVTFVVLYKHTVCTKNIHFLLIYRKANKYVYEKMLNALKSKCGNATTTDQPKSPQWKLVLLRRPDPEVIKLIKNMPNVFAHLYQLVESISNFRVVVWYFSFYSNFERHPCKQTVENLIWFWQVALFCRYPTKRTIY